MRKLLTLFMLSMVATFAFAQERAADPTNLTHYKAVIKDASGNLMSNHAVQVRFTIFEGPSTQVFTETHNATTDAHGIVVLDMGSQNADWDAIDWGAALHYLKVEYDTGSGFVDLGTQPFRFVPYAQFAIKAFEAESAANVNFSDINGTPTTLAGYGITDAFSGSFANLTNVPTGLSDGDDVLTEAQVDAYANNNGYLALDPTDATTLPIVNNNSTGDSKAINITMNSTNNNKRGIDITMQGTTPATGVSAGISFKDEMSGNQNKFGIYQKFAGTGNAIIGVRNWFTGSSNYTTYIHGVENAINSNNDGNHNGTYNTLSGSGSGDHNGTYNDLYGAGTGVQRAIYNVVSNTGNNTHFGSYNLLSGTGTGNKYGVYSKVNTTAGGTHYAVYAEAEKAGSYAGYFKGDVYNAQNVKVVGELQGNDSGDADMKAYVYGYIDDSGNKMTSASSDGYTSSKISTGTYRITFSDTSLSYNQYIATAVVMDFSAPKIATIYHGNGVFDVHIWNLSGVHVDSVFTFVVYKK